jgi:streptogramin lyase
LLGKALPLRWAASVSVAVGVVVLVLAIALAQSVGGLAGKQIEVDVKPRAVDADRLGVWIAHAEGQVTQIDPDSNAPIGRTIEIPLESSVELFHVAAGLGAVWVMDTDGWIHRIDPESREVSDKVTRVGGEEGEITVALGRLWVNSYSSGTVVEIDPRTYEQRVMDVRAETATDLTYGHGWIWVSCDSAAPVDRQPSGISTVDDKVWVSNYARDTLTQIDIPTGRVDATLDAAAGPADIVNGSGSTSTPIPLRVSRVCKAVGCGWAGIEGTQLDPYSPICLPRISFMTSERGTGGHGGSSESIDAPQMSLFED